MDLHDVGVAVLQELWKKVAFAATDLASQTNDTMFEKESFREFSNHISHLSIIIESLHAKSVHITSLDSTRALLEALHSQLNRGRNIIRDYKSGSKMRFMLNSRSVLKQMQQLGKEIAETVSLLELANLDAALQLKSDTDKIINNLRSIESSSRTVTQDIASEIEESIASHVRNRDYTMKLLHKIAEASGSSVNASLVQNELALLKQEKEEMEAQKKQAEALQLSQLIKLLYNTDMVPCPPDSEEDFPVYQQNLIDSFTCPLCNELMTDPVVIVCGHSFERKAIQDHLQQGLNSCPICKQELPSIELTPNISLRGSIQEWKQNDSDMKFQNAVSGVTSGDPEIVNESLENLQALMEMPSYRAKVSEKGLISNMVDFLQFNNTNTHAALKCLYHLSCHSDENKEIMIEAGIMSYIVESFDKGDEDTEAIAILVELSTKATLVETIGNAKYCIPLLVCMLHNKNHDVAQRAEKVLENLSSITHFVIKMAEAGYFNPFVSRFIKGTFEIRASMAAAIVNTQIGDKNIKSFQHEEFIRKLVEMLSSSSPAYTIACLKSIKKLLLYPEMVKWFLGDPNTISHLINLISLTSDETHWKLETTEVLTSLIENIELSNFQKYPALQELQSQENVSLLVSLVTTSEAQLKVKVLQLLIVLTHRSETARDLVRSNKDAVDSLFCSLNSDQSEVRQQVMKLIYSVAEKHPDGVPLPPSPAKEHGINALVVILNSSPNNKERSAAAGIIRHLPTNDIIIDEILRRSELLKSIREVLSSGDDENCGVKTPINQDESLLENSLAVLLRYTHPTKPQLQREVCELELYPSLIRILTRGSSLAKEYAATALAYLSQSNDVLSPTDANITFTESSNSLLQQPNRFLPNMFRCCSSSTPKKSMCSIHGNSCSSRHTLCLVKADAVRPLVRTLSDTQSGAAEAALTALTTMLIDNRTLAEAARVIVDNQGVAAILEVLERGTPSAKDKALNLFHKILEHTKITHTQCPRAERILIHLLAQDELKKKTALVLRQMNLLPEQSSYF